MMYAILVKNGDYMMKGFSEGSDPLYGHGSWNCHSIWNSKQDATQALEIILTIQLFIEKAYGYKELKSIL